MHLYTLPIVQPDLRHEETIVQAANALAYLQSVITEVFDQIDRRIDTNNARIQSINQRLDVANQKGQQLVESRKAIQVLSPAEYTVAQCSDIPMTFTAQNLKPIPAPNHDYVVASKIEPINQRSAEEKLKFFHVNNILERGTVSAVGTGQPPMFVDTVDSLLLHSKPFNVFDDHRNADKIRRDRQPQRQLKSSEGSAFGHLGAAPPSISNRKMYQNKQEDKLFYSPTLNEAPNIELPLDLPDLPGIADNVSLSAIGRPSTITTGNMFLPDLPNLPDLDLNIIPPSELPAIPDAIIVGAGSTSVVDSAGVPPPPPPPPPPPMPPILPDMTPDQTTPIQQASPLPPLPPVAVESRPVERRTLPDVNDRSNLMDAIRKAGGKSTLRSTSVVDDKPVQNNPVPQTSGGGGSLMDDLNKRLAMRRKGISGAKDTSSASGEPQGVMNRISAMIPPPPQRKAAKDTSSGTSDDDEWN